MIKRVKIEGYKSFKNLDIELRPLSVIFGPNASGKSNFLDALYLLSRAVSQKNLKVAFEGHRGLPLESFYYGDEGYETNIQKDNLKFTIEVDIEISPTIREKVEEIVQAKRKGIDAPKSSKEIITEHLLRYCLTIEVSPKTGYLKVMDERLCAISRNGKEKKKPKPFIERKENRLHLRMEGQAHPVYHQIGLDYTIVSTALYEPHYPHITAFRMELANWYTYYLEPKTLMREEVPLAEIESIGPRGENLAAFLNTLKYRRIKDFENFNLSMKRILPSDASIEVELKEGRVGLRLSENGLWFSARLISEGTLRLIGFLSAIHPINPATMVAFEEPENGLHPIRLKIISNVLKNAVQSHEKQIIITTHSPILPGYFENNDLFVCVKEEHQTTIKPFSSFGPLFRRMDIEHTLEDRILRGDLGG